MNPTMSSIGFSVMLQTDFASAVQRVTDALRAEGFGVLTEIDVQSTLKNKLNVEFRPYKILGACNPPLAHRALTIAPEAGLLLPCNVTIAQAESNQIEIGIVNPISMLGFIGRPELEPVAQEAEARLSRVVESLKE